MSIEEAKFKSEGEQEGECSGIMYKVTFVVGELDLYLRIGYLMQWNSQIMISVCAANKILHLSTCGLQVNPENCHHDASRSSLAAAGSSVCIA